MGEISNKTLAVLVIIAILISLVGLFMGRGKIITVGRGTQTTGQLQATVSSQVSIRLVTSSISIGDSESVYNFDVWSSQSGDNCVTTGLHTAACDGTLGTTEKITVEVDGATPCNIGYYADRALFYRLWDGGSGSGGNNGDGGAAPTGDISDDAFQIKFTLTGTTQPCNSGYAGGSSFSADNTFGQANVDTGGIAEPLAAFCETNDFLDMYLGIKVPGNEPIGTKTATIWFEAGSAV